MMKQYPDFDAKHIFKTFNTNKYYNGDINGVDAFIAQSQIYTERLIECFKEYADRGYDVSDDYVQDEIFKECDYDICDLTDADILRIKLEIEKYCKYM